MLSPKSPCNTCPREDRDACSGSCQDLARYRRLLDALDPDESARARRARILDLGEALLSGLAAGQDRSP